MKLIIAPIVHPIGQLYQIPTYPKIAERIKDRATLKIKSENVDTIKGPILPIPLKQPSVIILSMTTG